MLYTLKAYNLRIPKLDKRAILYNFGLIVPPYLRTKTAMQSSCIWNLSRDRYAALCGVSKIFFFFYKTITSDDSADPNWIGQRKSRSHRLEYDINSVDNRNVMLI